MRMTRLKARIIKTILFVFISTGLFLSFFDINKFEQKFKKFKRYSKTHVGAVIINNTSQTVRVAEYKLVHKLPPGKSSRDIGIFDADGLVIDYPMFYKENVHFNGVLKFCDYSRLNLVERAGVIEIEAKNAWICRLLNDFDFYNTIDEAFK